MYRTRLNFKEAAIGLLAAGFVASYAASANAEIVRCSAVYQAEQIAYDFTIVLPERQDQRVWVLDGDDHSPSEILSDRPVGLSVIEWGLKGEGSTRAAFVQTVASSDGIALVGLFMIGDWPATVRAALKSDAKEFSFYRSDVFPRLVAKGHCQ